MREAAKQAERARWPTLDGPMPLADALRDVSAANRFLLDPSGESFPSVIEGSAALLVGPEGGWTPEELREAIAAGWVVVALAAGKLRAETAAIAAAVLARTALARGHQKVH